MANKEQAVRDAAATLKSAIDEASAAGLSVQWPSNAQGLDAIAVSETGKVKPQPIPADRVPTGQPLDLTDEERAALPALDPNASNDPATFTAAGGEAKGRKPKV